MVASNTEEPDSIGVNGEKVGYKNPPKKGQFSQTRQPSSDRRSRSGRSKGEDTRSADAVKIITEAIFEKIAMKRGNKKVNIPFIEAFMQSMKKNAFSSKLSDQIRFFKELIRLGVFDVEEYKRRFRRGIERHYARHIENWQELAGRFEEICFECRVVVLSLQAMTQASTLARMECTCGAAERHFAELDRFALSNYLDMPEEFGLDNGPFEWGTEAVEQAAGPARKSKKSQKKPKTAAPTAKDADDEFLAGMIGEDD